MTHPVVTEYELEIFIEPFRDADIDEFQTFHDSIMEKKVSAFLEQIGFESVRIGELKHYVDCSVYTCGAAHKGSEGPYLKMTTSDVLLGSERDLGEDKNYFTISVGSSRVVKTNTEELLIEN